MVGANGNTLKKNTTHLQQISKSTGSPNVSHITIPYAQQPPSAARQTLSHLLMKCSDGAVFSNLGLKLGDAPPIYNNFPGKPEDLPFFFCSPFSDNRFFGEVKRTHRGKWRVPQGLICRVLPEFASGFLGRWLIDCAETSKHHDIFQCIHISLFI